MFYSLFLLTVLSNHALSRISSVGVMSTTPAMHRLTTAMVKQRVSQIPATKSPAPVATHRSSPIAFGIWPLTYSIALQILSTMCGMDKSSTNCFTASIRTLISLMDISTTPISTRTLTRKAVRRTGRLTPLVRVRKPHVLSLARLGTLFSFVSTWTSTGGHTGRGILSVLCQESASCAVSCDLGHGKELRKCK